MKDFLYKLLEYIICLKLTITPSITDIKAITDYNFGIDRFMDKPPPTVPMGSYINIIFPSDYVLPSTTTCTATSWFVNGLPLLPTLTCTING